MVLMLCFWLSMLADVNAAKYTIGPRFRSNDTGSVETDIQQANPDSSVVFKCKPQQNYGVRAAYYAIKYGENSYSPPMPAKPYDPIPDNRAEKEQNFEFTMPAGNVVVWAEFVPTRTLHIKPGVHGRLKAQYGYTNEKDSSMVQNLPAMPIKFNVLPDFDKTSNQNYKLIDLELDNLDKSYCVMTEQEVTIYMPSDSVEVYVTPVFGKSNYTVERDDKANPSKNFGVILDNDKPKTREEVTATITTEKGYIPIGVEFKGSKQSWRVGKPKRLKNGGWEVVYRFKVDLEDVIVHVGLQKVYDITVNDTEKSGRVKTYVPEMIPDYPGVASENQEVPVVFQMPDGYGAKYTLRGDPKTPLVYHNALRNSFADEGKGDWVESSQYINYGMPVRVITDSVGNRYWQTSVKNTMWQTVSITPTTFPSHAIKDDKVTIAALASINPCRADSAKVSIVASGSFGTDAEQVVVDLSSKNTGWTTVLTTCQINKEASELKFLVTAQGKDNTKKRAYEGPMFDDLCLLLPTTGNNIRNEDVLIFKMGSKDVTIDYTPSGNPNTVGFSKASHATVTLTNTVTGEQGETVKAIKNDLIVIKAQAAEGYSISSINMKEGVNSTESAIRLHLDSIHDDTRDFYYHFIMETNQNPVLTLQTVKSNIVLKECYGGVAKADKDSVKKGDKVLLTVTPIPGSKLSQIRTSPAGIVTFQEEDVDATTGGGRYSFVMPSASLNIYPEFSVPIKTAAELDSISGSYGEFYLDNDLDLGDNWNHNVKIIGNFNGNGHCITYGGKKSLFSTVWNDGVVRHLYVKANVRGSDDYIGGIAQKNYGTIEDCEVSGRLRGDSIYCVVGGVAGLNDGTISHSHVLCDTIDAQTVYGIASMELKGTVTDNIFNGQFAYRAGRAYMISNDVKNATIGRNYYVRNDVNLRAEVCSNAEASTPATLAPMATELAETYPVFAASIKNQYSGGYAVKLSYPEGVSLVNISTYSAPVGSVVTASVKVTSNSHIGSITIAAPDNSDAQDCPFTDNRDSTYSFKFVMPAHDVKVTFRMQPGQYIYTPRQLMAIDDREGIFYLGSDIELNNWEKTLMLKGTLYGNGHTIRYSASNSCSGLFNKIRPKALLQGLRVVGSVETTTDCGGIAYENQGTIRDCHFTGRIRKISNKTKAMSVDAVSAIACILVKDKGVIDHCSASALLESVNSQENVDRNPICYQGVPAENKNLWVSPTKTGDYQRLLSESTAARNDYPVYAQGVIDKINPYVITGTDTIRVQNGQRLSELTITDGQRFECSSDIQVDRVVYKRKASTALESWALPFDFDRIAGSGTFEYHQIKEVNKVPELDSLGITLTLTASPEAVAYRTGEGWIVKSSASEYVLTNNNGPVTIKTTTNRPARLYASLNDKGLFYATYATISAKVASEGIIYTWNSAKQDFECSDVADIDPFRFYVQFYNDRKHEFVTFPRTSWGRQYAKSLKKAPRRLSEAVADGWQTVFLDPRYPQSVTAEMLDDYEVAYLTDVNAQTVGDAGAGNSPVANVVSLVYQLVNSEEELPEAIPLLVRPKRSDAKPLADEQTGAEIDALLLLSMITDDDYIRDEALDDFYMPHYWCASSTSRLDIWHLPSPEWYADWADTGCMMFDDNYFEQSFHCPAVTDTRTTAPMSYCISVLDTDTYEPLSLLGNRVYVEFIQPESEAMGIQSISGSPEGERTKAFTREGADGVYNLNGQRVSDNYRGLVIKNGRKVILKK